MFLLLALDGILANHAGLVFKRWETPALVLSALIGVKYYGRWRRVERFEELGQYCALWMVFGPAWVVLCYIVAAWDFPLHDTLLAQIDAALHFNWIEWHTFIRAHAWFEYSLIFAYNSIFMQSFVLVLYFAHTGRKDRNREMYWIAMLTATATVLISGLLPAIGPHVKLKSFERALLSIRGGKGFLQSATYRES
ncbi:MAG: phosphatase PAP2 family protein [Candidatus Binataceae bacterium]